MNYDTRAQGFPNAPPNRPANAESRWKSALLEQSLHVRITAPELTKCFGAIRRVAGREDELLHLLGRGLVKHVTHFEERFTRVRVHDLRPKIAVVAGRIIIAREQVQELRQSMPERDLFRCTDPRQDLLLERLR